MRVLFDNGVPRPLRRYLKPHRVTLSKELGWAGYSNGELLRRAAQDFDVLITTDSNLPYQQNLTKYDIAVIVLRAYRLELPRYLTLVPDMLHWIEQLPPRRIIYLYEDEHLRELDERKGT